MPRKITLSAIIALFVLIPVVLFGVLSAGDSVSADSPEKGVSAVLTGSFLPDHYDQGSGPFDPDSAGVFDDGADTLLSGPIPGLGRVTVESSAAWDFGTYLTNHPVAAVYNKPITMPRDHKHAGCTISSGGTHTFTATVTITKKNGDTLTAAIVGGSNTERVIFSAPGHVPNCVASGGTPGGSPFDGTHSETENTVVLVFKITGGTGKLAGSTGDGVLMYVYNTKEPHELLEASIFLKLVKP